MAEVFGVVLKKLWDEVQDVPNEISRLVRQLELPRPVLAEMESEFTQQTHKVYHNSAASLSMEYCQQAVAELDALAEDLRSRIDAAKRSRRNITKLKAALKKEQIQGYQEKMQFALSLLSLSQQTHTISVVKSRFLAFRNPAPQARVQLPSWISETFWDFQAYRACTGWKVSLKPWTMRQTNDPIFIDVRSGSLDDVQKALKCNEASLQDIDEQGWTLLHVRALPIKALESGIR
ncbi:uncharacterized protein GLRG_08151 [Colletotrichum graminicola M1.001]|uniref:Uncharacterized protein n=1 Tax=Colletotrichum graminicola (strain M1.001 / M2 / FGSC 10212) TaxID=645133 RepID=E3QQ69_COLGM|nr:uncharacterized protein GLRG_08151 [Colletotrichum graminicola M1.001]EFQ33007.1 hypothetical protein GLRG_08151 [Colletotrichum graminicola M1.001]